jgi:hypothetical protein
MIDLALSREHAALLAAGMERHASVRELGDGYALFRAGRVTHVWKDQFNIVHAIVRDDGGDRKLQLDLDFFLASECACGGDAGGRSSPKICAHMAAVFFLIYGEHDDPAAWLDEVIREKESPRRDAKGGMPDGALPGSGAAAGGRFTGRPDASATPAPAVEPGRPDLWGPPIDREMDRLSRQLGVRRRIDIFYMNACRKLFSFAEPWPQRERARFRLFAALRIMRHAELRLQELQGPDPVLVRMVQDLDGMFAAHVGHEAETLAAASSGEGGMSGSDEMERIVLEQARQVLPPPGVPVLDWSGIHRRLWSRLFADEAVRRGEADRLKQLAGQTEHEPLRDQIRQCVAHLHWLDGNDAAAMAELSALGQQAPGQLAVYWETLCNTGSWDRFKAWFSFALPHLQHADGDTFQRALEAARACRDATGDEAFLRRTLTGLLPRSAHALAAFLVETGRLEEWAYFHLLNGTPVDRLDRDQRLLVERTAPRLMLPLYHQGMERLIAARNRTAYRDIARLAKRLQTLYRTLGEEDKFRSFLEQLYARNGRQHALMEELQKGNLFA